MPSFAPVDAARLASLATGRGGAPTAEEWPFVALLLLVVALVGTRLMLAFGLTKVESWVVAGLAPLLVLVDAPIGEISPRVSLAANVAGCVIPVAVGIKVFIEGRTPWPEGLLVVGVGIVASYLSSHVVPDRGILLQYRIPAVIIGILASGLFYQKPLAAGPVAFAAGAIGVVVGADVMHLQDLAVAGGAGRIILGGAGLLDGIVLVAVLAAGIAECVAALLRAVVGVRVPSRPVA